MISQVIFRELQTAGISFLDGMMITFVYDLLRILRRGVPHGNLWIALEDLLFWIWTTLWVFSVFYRENDGSIRFYTIFSMVLGMLIYHQTISAPFVRILGGILKRILRVFGFPLKMGKNYIGFFGKKLKKLAKGIIMKVKMVNKSKLKRNKDNFGG